MCHFGFPGRKLEICSTISNDVPRPPWAWEKKLNNIGWWHVPPAYVAALHPTHNPYVNADMFVVVRNPYERMISEVYYWIQTNDKRKRIIEIMNDEKQFDNILNKMLSEFLTKMRRPHVSRKHLGMGNNIGYLENRGHLIPQYDYVYDVDRNKKIVNHVLRFENLREEFPNLMEIYNLPLELPLPNQKIGKTSDSKELGIHNLTNDNLLLIEDIHWDDFREFGYEMISR